MDGHSYPHCDKVLLYDLKTPKNEMETNIFETILLFAVPEEPREDIKKMKVLAHLYPGIPVLGAVQIDLSGDYQGMDVMAGGDYAAP